MEDEKKCKYRNCHCIIVAGRSHKQYCSRRHKESETKYKIRLKERTDKKSISK